MIAGKDAPCFGEAKNSWLTGTAAWTFVRVAEGLFGINADFAGLKVDPCIPKSWPGFTTTRKYRSVEYQIEVKNPNGVCKGVKSVTVDGKKVAGNVSTQAIEASHIDLAGERGEGHRRESRKEAGHVWEKVFLLSKESGRTV